MPVDLREGEAPAEPYTKRYAMFLAAQQELRPPGRNACCPNQVPFGRSLGIRTCSESTTDGRSQWCCGFLYGRPALIDFKPVCTSC